MAAAAYSQDGRWLVTADSAGDLVVRDPNTFAEIRRMSSEGGSSRGGFAFSDDGRYLVSTQDGKGRLWDVESGQLIGQPIEGAPTASPASFPGQPAGFVTATDTHIQIWRFDPPSWVDVACRAAGPQPHPRRVAAVRAAGHAVSGDLRPVANRRLMAR